MDKIFMVSILMTFVGFVALAGSASTTDFEDALTNIDGKCTKSTAVSSQCSNEKSAVETPLTTDDVTTACAERGDYATCLSGACDPDTDLEKFKNTIETTCQSGSPNKTAIQDALTGIDGKCVKSVDVSTQCSAQKDAVENPLTTSDLTTACTKLPDYKTCLSSACDPNGVLTNSIDTMEEKCAIEDFLLVLSIIDTQCTRSSNAVTDPCKTVKDDVDAQLRGDSLTDACKKLPGYKMCLLINCDSSTDLSNSISKMENTCDMSPSEVTDLQDVLNIIDSLCVKNSAAVANPCPTEKQEMNTQLQSDSLTEACKELPDYKTCLLRDCDKAKNLTRSIDIMEDKCGSGFMKISMSMLTLFVAAIVNLL